MSNEVERVFFGRVLPERANVNVSPFKLMAGSTAANLAEVTISIGASQVTARVIGDGGYDLSTLKNVVKTIVSVLVDTLGFEKGCGYQVEITGSDGPEGQIVYGVDFGGLSIDGDLPFALLLQAQLLDQDSSRACLRRALGDYRRAILEPDDTTFHAFRAVEGLSYAFGRNPKAGIPRMCVSLNLDPGWVQNTLEAPAREVRHGKLVAATHDQRQAALVAARLVMQRYAMWLIGEKQPLPVAQFPPVAPK